MRYITMILSICGTLASPGAGNGQTTSSPTEVAHTYLETLYAFDFEALPELLTEDAVFQDVTATPLAGAALRYNGRDEIVARFATSSSDSRNATFEIRSQFTTGDHVVFNLMYRTELKGEAVGIPGEWVPVAIPAVTVIRVAGGLVSEHLDYVNYDELLRQIAAFPELD